MFRFQIIEHYIILSRPTHFGSDHWRPKYSLQTARHSGVFFLASNLSMALPIQAAVSFLRWTFMLHNKSHWNNNTGGHRYSRIRLFAEQITGENRE